jgi:RHS repeat-associated protein
MDMTYTFSGTQNNGRITQSTDGTIPGGETVVYTYDTLNRLTKAETTSAAWGEAYTYDGFGNLTAKMPTKGTAPTMTAAYDAATNHQVGQTYDANGNPGFNGTYPYDVENHLLQPLTSGTSPQWTYDPSGKRVFAKTPGNGTTVATTCEIYFYGITGQRLVTYQCGYNDQTGGNGQFWYQVKSRNVYFGGKLMRSGGVTVVTDRLGSVRANSNGERMSYFPYGEERTSTTDGREKFGTYFRDQAANGGLDYADQRYYASANGRFLTPDPSGTSISLNDPQSFSRYSYGLSDPINHADPTGLCAINGVIYPDGQPPCPNVTSVTVTASPPPPGCIINGLWWPSDFCGINSPASARPAPTDPPPLTSQQAWTLAYDFQRQVQFGMNDCQALAGFAADVADATGTDDEFVKDFAALIPKINATQIGLRWFNSMALFLNTGQTSGYLQPFQNTVPDNPMTGWNGDQGHHFAAFFEFGYQYASLGPGSLSFFAYAYEWGQAGGSLLAPINWGDVRLGGVAAMIGYDLKMGYTTRGAVSSQISDTLCKH